MTDQVLGGSHDGDNNIFPGSAAFLEAPAPISNVRLIADAYLGEIVPQEDQDRLPRLDEVMAVEFEMREEIFRYTHAKVKVEQFHAALLQVLGPASETQVHFAFYHGSSFRDGANRVSLVDIFPRP
jgi:hypothetical protein